MESPVLEGVQWLSFRYRGFFVIYINVKMKNAKIEKYVLYHYKSKCFIMF